MFRLFTYFCCEACLWYEYMSMAEPRYTQECNNLADFQENFKEQLLLLQFVSRSGGLSERSSCVKHEILA